MALARLELQAPPASATQAWARRAQQAAGEALLCSVAFPLQQALKVCPAQWTPTGRPRGQGAGQDCPRPKGHDHTRVCFPSFGACGLYACVHEEGILCVLHASGVSHTHGHVAGALSMNMYAQYVAGCCLYLYSK